MTDLEIELQLLDIAASAFTGLSERERKEFRAYCSIDEDESLDINVLRAIEETAGTLARRLSGEYPELKSFMAKRSPQ